MVAVWPQAPISCWRCAHCIDGGTFVIGHYARTARLIRIETGPIVFLISLFR